MYFSNSTYNSLYNEILYDNGYDLNNSYLYYHKNDTSDLRDYYPEPNYNSIYQVGNQVIKKIEDLTHTMYTEQENLVNTKLKIDSLLNYIAVTCRQLSDPLYLIHVDDNISKYLSKKYNEDDDKRQIKHNYDFICHYIESTVILASYNSYKYSDKDKLNYLQHSKEVKELCNYNIKNLINDYTWTSGYGIGGDEIGFKINNIQFYLYIPYIKNLNETNISQSNFGKITLYNNSSGDNHYKHLEIVTSGYDFMTIHLGLIEFLKKIKDQEN